MELTGRLILDSRTNQLKDGRKVVNFCVAVNDSYKPKGSGEVKQVATLFNCSYWMNPNIGQYLTKGTLVELFGRVSANAWSNAEGEAKASLNFHVNNIKLHGGGKQGKQKESTIGSNANANDTDVANMADESDEDGLPF